MFRVSNWSGKEFRVDRCNPFYNLIARLFRHEIANLTINFSF